MDPAIQHGLDATPEAASIGDTPPRPVFVIGYMHSGTSMLVRMLRNNADVFCEGLETRFFETLPSIRRMYPDLRSDETLRAYLQYLVGMIQFGVHLADNSPSQSASALDDDRFEALFAAAKRQRAHGPLLRVAFDSLAGQAGKGWWLEKTPSHVFHVETILEHVPDARFVEIVRDPRDVLASKKTRRQTVWGSGRYTPDQARSKHLEKAYDPLWDTLSWKSAVRAGRAAARRYPLRIHTVQYERFVADPHAGLRGICDFLGLTFDPGMLQVVHKHQADWRPGEQTGVRADSVGRWRRALHAAETALCERLVRSEMDELGYEASSATWQARLRIPGLLFASAFEFVHRLIRRWRLGGIRLVANVLANYWRRFVKLLCR